MEQVLVAVDGSKHSEKVVDYACNLAKQLSAGIVLFSVVKLPSEPEWMQKFSEVENYPDAYAEYLREFMEKSAEKLSKKIQESGIQSRAITGSGNPAQAILETAKLENVSLIIVGLTGLHGLGRVRSLGSVARRVIENSTFPVIVVP